MKVDLNYRVVNHFAVAMWFDLNQSMRIVRRMDRCVAGVTQPLWERRERGEPNRTKAVRRKFKSGLIAFSHFDKRFNLYAHNEYVASRLIFPLALRLDRALEPVPHMGLLVIR